MRSIPSYRHPRTACGSSWAVWIRRRILTALVIALVTGCLAGLCRGVSATLATGPSSLADSLIRLHVIANSDTFEDQALKLKVRDAILARAAQILEGVTSKEEAERLIHEQLDQLSAVSAETVWAEGYDYEVSLSVGRFAFPDKVYGVLKVPAGEYDAVRVIIGAGRGSNWWCVIFPPLCFIDMSGVEQIAEGPQAPSLPALSGETEPSKWQSPGEEVSEGADERERLQAYLQAYVQSSEPEANRLDGRSVADAQGEGDSDHGSGRGGLMARLEGEIGKLARHFPLPRFAIQSWLRIF
jgi:stage II sporulation protein R